MDHAPTALGGEETEENAGKVKAMQRRLRQRRIWTTPQEAEAR